MSSKLQIKFRKHSRVTLSRTACPRPETALALAGPAAKAYIYCHANHGRYRPASQSGAMHELKQHKGFDKREFRFTDSKLFYVQGRLGESNEVDIPFENIDGERGSYRTSKTSLLLASIVLAIVALAAGLSPFGLLGARWAIVWIAAAGAVAFFGLYWNSRREFWKLKLKEDYLYLYKNLPSREQTEAFVKSLLEARNAYLRENYLQIDENLDYEQQFYNLRWLRSIAAINKEEFEAKYEELKQTVKPEKKKIGFGK